MYSAAKPAQPYSTKKFITIYFAPPREVNTPPSRPRPSFLSVQATSKAQSVFRYLTLIEVVDQLFVDRSLKRAFEGVEQHPAQLLHVVLLEGVLIQQKKKKKKDTRTTTRFRFGKETR